MCHTRLTIPSLRGSRRLSTLLLWVGILFATTSLPGTALAGPPKIGKSDSGWSNGLWSSLTSWKLPSLPKVTAASSKASSSKSSQPSFTEATRKSMTRTWNSVERTTYSAWESTKNALRPYDPPAKKSASQRQAAESGGFWSGLFGGSEVPQSEATVNDFLRQPMPR